MTGKMQKELQTMVSSESGMVEILTILVSSLLLVVSSWFLSNVVIHHQIVDAHIKKFKEEYQIEGVLVEAIQLLKGKDSNFQKDDIISLYNPLFCFSITDGKITIDKIEDRGQDVPFWAEVAFTWEGDELKINRVETRYNLPYSR